MGSLLKYLRHYKKETVLAPLFKFLEASFELFVPLVMANLIDIGIAQEDKSYIIRTCLILVALGLIGLTCSLTAQYFAAKAATGFSAELREALFQRIQNFTFTQIDTMGTSTLITRMTSDVNQVQTAVNLVLRLFLRSPCIVIGAAIMAFTVDVKGAIVFAVAIPFLAIVVFTVMAVTMPLYRKVQENLDQVLLRTRENLTGARVLRAFNKEVDEERKFKENNRALTRAQEVAGRISALMNPLTYVIVNLALMTLIYTGALRVNSGALTQGEVIALLNYMSQILIELVKFANLIITMTKGIASGNRIQTVLEQDEKMEEGTATWSEEERTVPEVEFRDVSFAYANAGDLSLENISFTAEPGQTIGVIGGTGSGKSTLVNLISRFYDATDGQVLVHGRDVRDYKIEELREKIAVVFQNTALFKGTIEENLKWGDENATREDMIRALRISQSYDFVMQKKGGLQFRIEQGGKNLSGGQKQRLTIARALMRKAPILILDDSSSALDYATDAALRKAIHEMEENPLVFLVSQRASTVQSADTILVLDDGRLAGKGCHEELLKNCEVYQEIYYSQYQKGVAEDGRR